MGDWIDELVDNQLTQHRGLCSNPMFASIPCLPRGAAEGDEYKMWTGAARWRPDGGWGAAGYTCVVLPWELVDE